MELTETTTTAATEKTALQPYAVRLLFVQVTNVVAYLASRWKWLLLLGLGAAVLGWVYAGTKKPLYEAEISFALDEGAAQGVKTELSTLGQQLGITSMMEAGGVFSSISNLNELMRSRLMVEKTLYTRVAPAGHSIVLADFFLDSLGYRRKWLGSDSDTSLFDVRKRNSREDSVRRSGIIRNMYETMLAKHLKIDKKGSGTSIISVRCISQNELFSKFFLETLTGVVTRYYVETKTERARRNVDFLQAKVDSLSRVLGASLYGHASATDANMNPSYARVLVPALRQQTEIDVNRAAYTEVVRSLEAEKVILQRETPLFQYLDLPLLPLRRTDTSVLLYVLAFGLLGMMITAFALLAARVYQHIMASSDADNSGEVDG